MVDKPMVSEVTQTVIQDGQLYRSRAEPIIKNLARKRANGTYDDAKSLKAWRYLADDGVRQYLRFGGPSHHDASGRLLDYAPGDRGQPVDTRLVDKATKDAIAKELHDHYEEQVAREEVRVSASRRARAHVRRPPRHRYTQPYGLPPLTKERQ